MKLKLRESIIKKSQPVPRLDVGGTLSQLVPALGIQYISTTPEVANLTAIQQVEAARQAQQAKLSEERAKFIPSEQVASEYFEKAKGLTKDVTNLMEQWKSEREKFYTRIQSDPNENWVFTPEGRQSFRRLMGLLSYDKLNELANNKSLFDEEVKKAREGNTLNDIFYHNGNVYLQNNQSGHILPMDAVQYAQLKEQAGSPLQLIQPLTIGEYANYINTQQGGKGGIASFGSQLSYQKALDELISTFDHVAKSSYESVSDELDSMLISQQDVPTMKTTLQKREGNTAQLMAAFHTVKDRLSAAAQDAIKAELLKRGQNPDSSPVFIKNLAEAERRKRTESTIVQKSTRDPLLGTVDFKKSGSGQDGGLSLFSEGEQGNFTESLSTDGRWLSMERDNQVPFVNRSTTQLISTKDVQKNIPIPSGTAYKIGDGDSSHGNGKPVKMSSLHGAIRDKPKVALFFTGEEFTGNPANPKTVKFSTNQEMKGALVFSGDKATTKERDLAAGKIQTMILPDGRNVKYFYDMDEEKYRVVYEKGVNVYRPVNEDSKLTNELILTEITPAESMVFFRTPHLSGLRTDKNYVYNGRETDELGKVMAYMLSNEGATAQTTLDLRDAIIGIRSAKNNEQKAYYTQRVNRIVNDYVYEQQAIELARSTPQLKPIINPKSVDVTGEY